MCRLWRGGSSIHSDVPSMCSVNLRGSEVSSAGERGRLDARCLEPMRGRGSEK